MPKISVTFYPDTFTRLQEHTILKKIPIAHYIRNLVEIGFRVIEASYKFRAVPSIKSLI
jgi:hypothetical protein